MGLYVASRPVVARGTLVLLCLPPWAAALARRRGYVSGGGRCAAGTLPVGKPVLAIAGDTVCVTPSGLRVHGELVLNSRALLRDRRGRILPRPVFGSYVVRTGTVWVVSSHSALSFDSRYFGPVSTGEIRSTIRPTRATGG